MKTLIVLLTVMLLIVSSALAAEKERVVVGIVDTNEPGWRAETLNPTIARLEKALPGRRIELLELSVYRTIDDVGRIRPDFIVAPSDVFLQLINVYGAQALVVRKTNRAADTLRRFDADCPQYQYDNSLACRSARQNGSGFPARQSWRLARIAGRNPSAGI